MNSEQHPGLYLHVPFCRSKCFYCDFYSVASSAAIPAWLHAVRKEALLYREKFHDFDSLYLGGGTPSILEERDLACLLECLLEHFTFCADTEMTMEANPESLTEHKLKTIKNLGVNRISLGIQSLNDRELKYLGRIHSSKDALGSLDMVRSCGFSNIGVDLIYGFEIQTISGWKKTLDRILEFRPEHISCYQMSFEKGTPLWKMREAGRARSVGERLESAFFIWTSRYLEKQGYHHYEISNFAARPEFMSRHNRKYWTHVPYLGLGPSAHSWQDGQPENPAGRLAAAPGGAGKRWWNVKSIRKYCQLLEEGKAPVEGSEILSEEQFELERLGLGFRTSEGVDIGALRGGPETDNVLAQLKRSGLVRVEGGRVRPTRRGFLVADSLPLMF